MRPRGKPWRARAQDRGASTSSVMLGHAIGVLIERSADLKLESLLKEQAYCPRSEGIAPKVAEPVSCQHANERING